MLKLFEEEQVHFFKFCWFQFALFCVLLNSIIKNRNNPTIEFSLTNYSSNDLWLVLPRCNIVVLAEAPNQLSAISELLEEHASLVVDVGALRSYVRAIYVHDRTVSSESFVYVLEETNSGVGCVDLEKFHSIVDAVCDCRVVAQRCWNKAERLQVSTSQAVDVSCFRAYIRSRNRRLRRRWCCKVWAWDMQNA